MDGETFEKIFFIFVVILGLFLAFCFVMSSATDIPFFQNVVDFVFNGGNALLGAYGRIAGWVLIGLLVIVALIIFAPGLLIGLVILIAAAALFLAGMLIKGIVS